MLSKRRLISLDAAGPDLRGRGDSDGHSWRTTIGKRIERRMDRLDPLTVRARLYEDLIDEIDPLLADLVLECCRWNQSAAARIPGVDPGTLRAKVAKPD